MGLLAIALVLAGACGTVAVLRWRRIDACAAAAMTATSVEIALFIIESISLHRIDAVMYAMVGPVMMIALLWTSASLVVTFSALHSARC